jgi:uncharacterized protein YybS (DUF2232 family)
VPDKSVFNLQQIGVSLLAGLAAAAVGAVVTRGGVGGLLFAHIAPLPIVIIALGFGITHAASTALLATVILSIWPHPIVGMGYALLVALPAFMASYAASGAPRGGRDLLTKNLSSWAALAPAAMLSMAAIFWIIVASIQFGSLDEALSTVQGRAYLLFQMMQKEGMIDEKADLSALSGAFARSVPGFMASYGLLIHVLNLWIGGRIAQASGLLGRPWPDIAGDYRLPRAVAGLFASGLALMFFGGPSAAIGVVLLATMGLLLTFQGLAVIHEFLRALQFSVLVLSALYFFAGVLTVWLGWPIAFLAALGVADMFFDYRNRKLPGLTKPTPPAPTGGPDEKPD